mgnify:CR=1 FL=1
MKIVKPFSIFGSKVTEQANIFTIFTTVFSSAVCYGWIEGEIYPHYPFKDVLSLFGHFTWYHVVFLLLFFIISFFFSISKVMLSFKKGYVLAASLGSLIWGFWIEDMTYFAWRYPKEILSSESWVNWNLAGLSIAGFWVPTVYFLMSGGGFILFATAFIRGRKDFIARLPEAKITPKPASRIREFLIYSASILPFILVIWPICILAASLTSRAVFSLNITRILATSATVYFSTCIALVGSNIIYERLSYLPKS